MLVTGFLKYLCFSKVLCSSHICDFVFLHSCQLVSCYHIFKNHCGHLTVWNVSFLLLFVSMRFYFTGRHFFFFARIYVEYEFHQHLTWAKANCTFSDMTTTPTVYLLNEFIQKCLLPLYFQYFPPVCTVFSSVFLICTSDKSSESNEHKTQVVWLVACVNQV